MPWFIEQLNETGAAWTALMAAVLWQSTLLVLLAAAVASILRRASPGVRYWLWQIVAIKLLLMPFWTLPIALPEFGRQRSAEGMPASPFGSGEIVFDLPPPSGLPASTAKAELPPAPAPPWWVRLWEVSGAGRLTWQSWLMLLWLLGIAWQIGVVARQRIRLSRLLAQSDRLELNACQSRERQRADDPQTSRERQWADSTKPRPPLADLYPAIVAELSERLNLRRPPKIVLAEIDGSPFVCGVARPALVLPKEALISLNDGQLRQVVLHELAHVKRRDLVWGWISEAARIVYFFHPIVHWVLYRIRLERELACDQVAMAHSGRDAAEYADTLVQVVSRSLPADPTETRFADTDQPHAQNETRLAATRRVAGPVKHRDQNETRFADTDQQHAQNETRLAATRRVAGPDPHPLQPEQQP